MCAEQNGTKRGGCWRMAIVWLPLNTGRAPKEGRLTKALLNSESLGFQRRLTRPTQHGGKLAYCWFKGGSAECRVRPASWGVVDRVCAMLVAVMKTGEDNAEKTASGRKMAAAAAAVNSRLTRVARKGQEDERPVSWAWHRDLKLLVGCSGQPLKIPTADSRMHGGRRSAHLPSHKIKIREDPRNTGPVSRRAWPGSGEGLEREGSLGAVDGTGRRDWSGSSSEQALCFPMPARRHGGQHWRTTRPRGHGGHGGHGGHAAVPFHLPCRVGCSVDAPARAVESGREDVVDSQILANC